MMFQTFDEIEKELAIKKEQKYPKVKTFGFYFKDSNTRRVTFHDGEFLLWVYPTVEEGINNYPFEAVSMDEVYTFWLPHLMEKTWFNKDFYFDVIELAKYIFRSEANK